MRLTWLAHLLALAAPLAMVACSTPQVAPRPQPRTLYWPTPPDQPRFMYEAVLRDSSSIKRAGPDDKLNRALLGMEGDVAAQMRKPLAVAARHGLIYVSDTEARRIVVFDVPRRRFFSFGFRLEGALRRPAGIAIDGDRNVYVADVLRQQVVVYDAYGLYQRTVGSPAELERPTGVAVSRGGDRVYVVDAGGVESDVHKVSAFDKSGRKLFELGPRGSEPGRFNLPVDAAVADDGTLFVLDAGNFRVQAFDRDGKFLRAFGSVGNGFGQFARPRGIALDREGNVYVSDASFGNIQIFNPEGQLLLAVGEPSANDKPGGYRLVAGVSVDETGRLYVVDQYFKKVEVIRRLRDEEGRALLMQQRT